MRHYVRWRVQQWVLGADSDLPRTVTGGAVATGRVRGAAADLVRLSGVSPSAVTQIVKNNLLPDTASCGAIARALGLSLHELIELAMKCHAIDRDVAASIRNPGRRGRP